MLPQPVAMELVKNCLADRGGIALFIHTSWNSDNLERNDAVSNERIFFVRKKEIFEKLDLVSRKSKQQIKGAYKDIE